MVFSKNEGDCHQCRIVSFLKCFFLEKIRFGSSIDNDVKNKPYR